MNKLFGRAFLLFAMCVVCAPAIAAQSNDEGKNEFSIWGGFSPDSSTAFKGSGRTPDARFGILNVRYARRFNTGDQVNLKYTLDVTPAAVLSYPDYEYLRLPLNTFVATRPRREKRFGFGTSPVGLQANFRPRKTLQPFVDITGGFVYFNKNVPNDVGTRFNFTADIGAGLEYKLDHGKAVTFGYKYFHISNGNRGVQNPGFDNNLFYVGYTFSKR